MIGVSSESTLFGVTFPICDHHEREFLWSSRKDVPVIFAKGVFVIISKEYLSSSRKCGCDPHGKMFLGFSRKDVVVYMKIDKFAIPQRISAILYTGNTLLIENGLYQLAS